MIDLSDKAARKPVSFFNSDLSAHVQTLQARVLNESSVRYKGRVVSVRGTSIRITGLPVRIGQRCMLAGSGIGASSDKPLSTRARDASLKTALDLEAEVVGFDGNEAILIPFGELQGLALGTQVQLSDSVEDVGVSSGLLGRVLDGFGRPLDEEPLPNPERYTPLRGIAPNPLKRQRVTSTLNTGIKAIDALLTVGKGQRVGVFAPAGAGKSTLLGMLAEAHDVDVVVIALIGERGREVREFIEDALSDIGRRRSVCIVATSDRPAIERINAAHTATALAEGFAQDGKNVLLLVDSITRYARAVREVGLAAGEPPVRQGFTPSVFAELPRLLERSGTTEQGSITAFYTVLTDDEQASDPIAEEVRSILDGNIVLSRRLAERNHYPAIDIAQSISRLFQKLASPRQAELAALARQVLAKFQEIELLVQVGEYQTGTDPVGDKALAVIEKLDAWLTQPATEWFNTEAIIDELTSVLRADTNE